MAIAGTLTYKTELDTSGVKKSGSTVKSIIAGLGITKLISKAMSTINSSLDDAIKRVDTLNNFPKVMKSLGISAEDSSKAINKMSEKLAGLPTTLDQGANAVKRFTSYNGDVTKSTDIFLALNNAILAGGASTEIQASALEQLTQAYTKGKPEAQDWKIIMQAMPAQLKQVAETMGYTSTAIGGDFYNALQKGEISMDDFMDTVVKLNEKGGKGFASFSEQAKVGVQGIGTAITVAKTQVVKGLADIVNSIDKSLKKSGTSINKIITDLGKKAKEVLDKIAKALSKIDFKKLYNTLKTLIPIITGVAVALGTMYTATKLLTIVSTITKTIQTFQVGIVALQNTAILCGSSLSTLRAGLMMLNLNPITLAITGVAGLTTGLIALQKASEQHMTTTQKLNKEFEQYNEAMEKADESRQKYLDVHMNEINYAQQLYGELETLVDENGKVKEGYEDRVNFILGELNDALGTELSMTNGVVQGYTDLRQSIDKVIESKRANTLLNAEEEKYNTAKDKRNQLEKDYVEAQKEYNAKVDERKKLLKDIQKEYGLTNDQLKQVAKNYEYIDENGNKVNLRFEKLVKDLPTLNGEIQSHKNMLEEAKGTYEDNEKTIADYEQALKYLADGNYEAVMKMYEDTTNYHGKIKDANGKSYTNEIDAQKGYLEQLKQNKKNYNEDVYNLLVKSAEERIKALEKEQAEEDKKTKASQSTITKTYKDGIDERIDITKEANKKFEKGGSDNTLSYAKGIESKKETAKQKSKEVGDSALSQMDKSGDAYNKGRDFTQGYINGMSSLLSSVRNTATNIVNQALASAQKAQDSHSPAKKTKKLGNDFIDGYTIGIENGEKELINATNDIVDNVLNAMDINKELEDMYKEINKTIQMENAKLNFDVSSNDIYNKSMQLPAIIDLNANFDGTIPVELNLDGEKIYSNQQKVALRKSVQYGGVK